MLGWPSFESRDGTVPEGQFVFEAERKMVDRERWLWIDPRISSIRATARISGPIRMERLCGQEKY